MPKDLACCKNKKEEEITNFNKYKRDKFGGDSVQYEKAVRQ